LGRYSECVCVLVLLSTEYGGVRSTPATKCLNYDGDDRITAGWYIPYRKYCTILFLVPPSRSWY